jgi:tetratricopeptide (TPR) repeat protein
MKKIFLMVIILIAFQSQNVYSQWNGLNDLGDSNLKLALLYFDAKEYCEADKYFNDALGSYYQSIQYNNANNGSIEYPRAQIEKINDVVKDSSYISLVIDNCIVTNQLNSAKRKINSELRNDSSNLNYRFQRGLVSYLAKEFDEALPDFSFIISKNQQGNSLHYYMRGKIYSKLNKYNEALLDFNKTIELGLDNDVVYFERGLVYKKMGNYELATNDFNKAIELGTQDINAYFELAKIYENDSLKKYDAAISIYNKALEQWSSNEIIFYNRGYAYKNLKKYDKAIEDWKKAIKLNKSYKKELKSEIANVEKML